MDFFKRSKKRVDERIENVRNQIYDIWQKKALYFNEGMNFARFYYFFERYELKSRV